MPDRFSKSVRSRIMSAVRGKDTGPELALRSAIHRLGFRYGLTRRFPEIRCRPDMVFASRRVALFVDGCFWHKCPRCFRAPLSNKGYWVPKIRKNVARDRRQDAWLKRNGWMVIRVWEHDVREDIVRTTRKITKSLEMHNG